MEIISRHQNSRETWKKVIHCGEQIQFLRSDNQPTPGTCVKVFDLFCNQPVRRRHAEKIMSIEKIRKRMEIIAIGHPKTKIILSDTTDDNIIMKSTKTKNSLVSMIQVTGRSELTSSMIPVSIQNGDICISGFFSSFGITHYSKEHQYVYVNGRHMINSKIHKLINKILKGFMRCDENVDGKTKRYPLFIVHITCPFQFCDVTFEISKTLIEFTDWNIIEDTIKKMLDKDLPFFSSQTLLENQTPSQDSLQNDDMDDSSSSDSPSGVLNLSDFLSSESSSNSSLDEEEFTPNENEFRRHSDQPIIKNSKDKFVQPRKSKSLTNLREYAFSHKYSNLNTPNSIFSETIAQYRSSKSRKRKFDYPDDEPNSSSLVSAYQQSQSELQLQSASNSGDIQNLTYQQFNNDGNNIQPYPSQGNQILKAGPLLTSTSRLSFRTQFQRSNLNQNESKATPQVISKYMLNRMYVITQVDKKFILMKADNQLFIMDQHAADERVRVERFQKEIFGEDRKQANVNIHSCCPPLKTKVSIRDTMMLRIYKNHLKRWGWNYEFSNDNSKLGFQYEAKIKNSSNNENQSIEELIIYTVPEIMGVKLFKEDLLEYARQLHESGGTRFTKPDSIQRVLNSKACRSAVMFGDPLSVQECEDIVLDLSECTLPFQCAHGRPSLVPLVDLETLNIESKDNCQGFTYNGFDRFMLRQEKTKKK